MDKLTNTLCIRINPFYFLEVNLDHPINLYFKIINEKIFVASFVAIEFSFSTFKGK